MDAEEQTIVELAYPGEYLSRLGYAETKTCKIRLSRKGQGLLARMYARKQSAKQIVGLRLDNDALPIAGAAIFDDAGNQVGGVTSSTISPLSSRNAICLGIVKKPFVQDGKVVQIPAEGAMQKATVSTKLRFLHEPRTT